MFYFKTDYVLFQEIFCIKAILDAKKPSNKNELISYCFLKEKTFKTLIYSISVSLNWKFLRNGTF